MKIFLPDYSIGDDVILVPMNFREYIRFRNWAKIEAGVGDMLEGGAMVWCFKRLRGGAKELVRVLVSRDVAMDGFQLAAARGLTPNQVRATWAAWSKLCRRVKFTNPFIVAERISPGRVWPSTHYGIDPALRELLFKIHPDLASAAPAETAEPPTPTPPPATRYTPAAPLLEEDRW